MGVIQNFHYSTWTDFKSDFAKDIQFDFGTLEQEKILFRGQGNADYKLQSTFDRLYYDLSGEEKAKIANDLITRFRKECDGRVIGFSSYASGVILALARHHGLPTRLLDWSISPYIAAFFAFSSAYYDTKAGSEVAVFAFKRNSSYENTGITIIDVPNENNQRQMNQMGKYMQLTTYHNTIEDFLIEGERHLGIEGTILYKLMIPTSEAKIALLELNLMNINASRLMGDYDGFAQTAFLNCMLNRE